MSGPDDKPVESAAPASGSAGSDTSEEQAAVEADFDALIAETKRERDEYLELAQRARADFENFRKRAAREASDAERRGRVRLAEGLVPVLDNLERALRAAGVNPIAEADPADAEQPSEEVSAHEALAQGVALVHDELRAVLERGGVEAYDPAGEPFDPAWHEALATRGREGTDSGVVLETVEKGYRLDGQVLRPARVIVSE
ncbi:MAG: nucleotide exchange factor GrpE [Thermoleophilaceae bacterium]